MPETLTAHIEAPQRWQMDHDAVGRVLVANADVTLATSRIARALNDPDQHHTLPLLLIDLGTVTRALLDIVNACAPDVAAAMARRLSTVTALHVTEREGRA